MRQTAITPGKLTLYPVGTKKVFCDRPGKCGNIEIIGSFSYVHDFTGLKKDIDFIVHLVIRIVFNGM